MESYENEEYVNKIWASQALSITPDELIVKLEGILWGTHMNEETWKEVKETIKHYTIPKWYSEEESKELKETYTEWNNRERK